MVKINTYMKLLQIKERLKLSWELSQQEEKPNCEKLKNN